MSDSTIERDSFSDLMTTSRLKALAARIEDPPPHDRAGNPGSSPGQALASLASVISRLTFSEMMMLAEGIIHKLPEQPSPSALAPFSLAIGLRDWATNTA